MQHPFEALAPEYSGLMAQMVVTREAEVEATANRLLAYVDAGHYEVGCAATGVPQIVAAASFEREAGSNFRLNPAQGDPWDRVSVHVPRGQPPFPNWAAAQIAAYKIDGLDKIGASNWTWARACYEEELFNGFGPRNHGKHTGYLWAGTNIYTGGKYVADNDWNPSAIDQQLGVVPIMFRMVQLRPALVLADAFPTHVLAPSIVPTPDAVPQGHTDAATLQAALNKLGADPALTVDDNYGRNTRRAVMAFQQKVGLDVDGIAGPDTWRAIETKLAAATGS